MKRESLRLRLLIVWAVFIALALQVVGVGLRLLYERSITQRTANELSADLRQLQRGMETREDGSIDIVRAPTDPQFDILLGGRYWQVQENGLALAKSPSLGTGELPLPPYFKPALEKQTAYLDGPEKQRLYAVVRLHSIAAMPARSARQLTITTAVDAYEISEDTGRFTADLFKTLAALSALLLLGAWLHVTIGLRPLETLRARVAEVRSGEADRIRGDYPDEVMQLVDETNSLLEAQDRAISAARARAGDLAHGLNTPLAVMSAKSRDLKRKGESEIALELDRQIETMHRHVERELARARARGPGGTGHAPVDTAMLVRSLIHAIDTLPRKIPVDWMDDLPQTMMLSVDRDDFNNILGNLLENAYKWAKGSIRISCTRHGAAAEFVIEDDGPGVPVEKMAQVLERGVRADTSVAGTGLGLAIVKDLVELYSGSFELARSSMGGLKVTVKLPS